MIQAEAGIYAWLHNALLGLESNAAQRKWSCQKRRDSQSYASTDMCYHNVAALHDILAGTCCSVRK